MTRSQRKPLLTRQTAVPTSASTRAASGGLGGPFRFTAGRAMSGSLSAGRQADWGDCRHRQLSRQGTNSRRAPPRRGEGAVAHSGEAWLQPPRVLWRVRGQTRRPRCDRPGALRRLDRLGEVARDRTGFQSDLLLPSEGRQLHALASRQGHPVVLDPARGRVSADRRRDGQGARDGVRDQFVDP